MIPARRILPASCWQARSAAPIVIRMRKARAEIRDVNNDLRAAVERLKALHASLPVSPQEERMLEGEMEPDFATEARAIIECVIPDRLEPAIEALSQAAGIQRKGRRAKRTADR